MKSDRSKQKELLNQALAEAAGKGDVESTLGLVSQGGDMQVAMQEAGYGGHIDLVKQLIKRNGNPDFAVFGAAQAGRSDAVKFLLEQQAKIDSAITGAVVGGHKDLVIELIGMGANLHLSVYYAMQCRRFELVNEMMEMGASLDYAVNGVKKSNFADNEEILSLFLTFIDDVELRKLVALAAVEKNPALDPGIKDCFESASFMNEFMHNNGFEYHEVSGIKAINANQEELILRAQEAKQGAKESQSVSGVVLLRDGLFARVPMRQPALIDDSTNEHKCRIC